MKLTSVKTAILSMSVVAFLGVPAVAMANEGIINLRGVPGEGSCFAASVFVDGSYRVLMTCRDMRTALSPEQNRFVVWQNTDASGKPKRLGEVINGKFQGGTDQKFTRLYITAESNNYAQKPSDSLLLEGYVQEIDFGKGVDAGAFISTPTPTPSKTNVVTKAATKTTTAAGEVVTTEPKAGTSLGSAVGAIVKVALLGFGALLVVVGVFSYLSRRRSL